MLRPNRQFRVNSVCDLHAHRAESEVSRSCPALAREKQTLLKQRVHTVALNLETKHNISFNLSPLFKLKPLYYYYYLTLSYK